MYPCWVFDMVRHKVNCSVINTSSTIVMSKIMKLQIAAAQLRGDLSVPDQMASCVGDAGRGTIVVDRVGGSIELHHNHRPVATAGQQQHGL